VAQQPEAERISRDEQEPRDLRDTGEASAPVLDRPQAGAETYVTPSMRAAAVRATAEELARRYAGPRTLRGTAGRLPTLADLGHYAEFLAETAADGSPEVFGEYLAWFAAAAARRGAPVAPIAEAAGLVGAALAARLDPAAAERVRVAVAVGRQRLEGLNGGSDPEAKTLEPGVAPLVEALLAGDLAAARAAMPPLPPGQETFAEAVARFVEPALAEVGTRWETNRITVDEEHRATALARRLLSEIRAQAPQAAAVGRTAVFAAMEGNDHGFGTEVVAETFALAGWRVEALGADVPRARLLAAIERMRPDVLGLSASMAEQLPGLRRVLREVRGSFVSRCPAVLVGGRPFAAIEGAWRWVGADAWSRSAGDAVREVA
jgi:methanogenic corrinoid protein MtbC1